MKIDDTLTGYDLETFKRKVQALLSKKPPGFCAATCPQGDRPKFFMAIYSLSTYLFGVFEIKNQLIGV